MHQATHKLLARLREHMHLDMMYISLSYDHRIIDGALGSTFLNAVSKELENFDINRAI